MLDSGRSLERMSDCTPRGMIVHDRTRLIGSLQTFFKIVLDELVITVDNSRTVFGYVAQLVRAPHS